jgi:hypothetical protein
MTNDNQNSTMCENTTSMCQNSDEQAIQEIEPSESKKSQLTHAF